MRDEWFGTTPDNGKTFWIEGVGPEFPVAGFGGPNGKEYTHWYKYKLQEIVNSFTKDYRSEGWTVKEVPVLEPELSLTK